MQPSKIERLKEIVAALNEYIGTVNSYDMQETAVLLGMAKLDLQMKIHSVSDRELHALCDALETRRPRPSENGSRAEPVKSSRSRRQGLGDVVALPISNRADAASFRSRRGVMTHQRSPRAFNGFRKGS
jgi:hypothetical protein